MKWVEQLKTRIRGTINLKKLVEDGCKIGNNFHAQEGVIIDPGHCWLVEIGDNVTLAPRVHILAHDASTKIPLGYTQIGRVKIGNNVFIGAGSIIMPSVTIDDDVIIGAGSVVTKSLSTGVWAGSPCVKIAEYDEWIKKKQRELETTHVFDEKWIYKNITKDMKKEMIELLKEKKGFII